MSVYLNNIPQASDRLSVSQGQFLVNFGQLNTQFGIDHVPFNNSGSNGSGFHKQVTLAADVASPSITGAVGSVHANSVGANHELFYKNATKDMQISNTVFQTYTPSVTAVRYTVTSVVGSKLIIGGVTFFTVSFAYTGLTTGSQTVTVTLPSTCASSGGQANLSTILGNTGIVPINSGNTSVSITINTIATVTGNFYINGFYI